MTKSEFYAGFKTLFADNKTPTLADALVLMENIAKDYDERDNLANNASVTKNQIDTLTAENEKLRQSNYKLFLSVGENAATGAAQSTTAQGTAINNTTTTTSGSNTTPTEEDLFSSFMEPGEKEVASVVDKFLSGLQYQESVTSPFAETRNADQSLASNNIV